MGVVVNFIMGPPEVGHDIPDTCGPRHVGGLQVPEGLALAPQASAAAKGPGILSEGARIKLLQQGPRIL